MAAQVLSGTGNVNYTNSTGQNVRVVINYLHADQNSGGTAYMNFAGIRQITIGQNVVYGKSLGYQHSTGRGDSAVLGQNATKYPSSVGAPPIPLEIALANGDTFSITATSSSKISYNIIVIPEAG